MSAVLIVRPRFGDFLVTSTPYFFGAWATGKASRRRARRCRTLPA